MTIHNTLENSIKSKVHERNIQFFSKDKQSILRLIICQKGELTIRVSNDLYKMKRGNLLVFMTDVCLEIDSETEDAIYYIRTLDEHFMDQIQLKSRTQIYLTLQDKPMISLTDQEIKVVLDMCHQLDEVYSNLDNVFRREICHYQMAIICCELAGLYSKYHEIPKVFLNRKYNLVQHFESLLTANYSHSRKLSYYADKLCVSPKYLSATVKEISNCTASYWIAHTVIMHAKKMLLNSDLTIQQISDELNFANPSFFGQYFKSFTGMTPHKWRISKLQNDISREI